MKKNIKILMLLNMINYISNFLFTFVFAYANKALKEHSVLLGIWGLTPYAILTVTSFILATDYKEEYKTFKKEAIFDWIIRAISCVVVFQEFTFSFLSLEYVIQQIILIVLLVINISLEYKMYQKLKKYVLIKKETNSIEKISEEEKQNIREIGQATTLGTVCFYIFCAVGISVPLTSEGVDDLYKLIAIIVSFCSFVWFLYENYQKCNLFYLDKQLAKKTFIRDSIYASIGFILCFITALNLFKTTHIIHFYITFIGILCLYPTIRTNRKMGLRYKKIVKILGDNFELYFNCKRKIK